MLVVVNEVIPSVALNAFQASVCDEQLLWVSVVRLRCQETRRSTSDVDVATPFARDSDPSLALQGSNHDHIGKFNDPFWLHSLSILHS